jgi:potassium channel subfamily K member 18
VYPLTIEGRVITILYGIIGIPLCLVVLMNLGKTFTHAIKYLWSFVRRFYYTGSFRRVRCMVPAGRLRMTLFQRFKYSIRQHSRWSRSRTGGFRRRDVAPPIEAPDDAKPALSDQEAADEEFVPYEVDDTFNLPPVVALLIAFIYMLLGSALYTAWETNWTYFDAFYFVFISLSTIGLGDVVPQHPKFFLLTAFYLFIGLALVAMVINFFMEVMNVSITKAADRVLSANLTRQRLVIDEETVQKIVKHLQQSSPPSPSQKETGGFDFNSSASVKRRGSV